MSERGNEEYLELKTLNLTMSLKFICNIELFMLRTQILDLYIISSKGLLYLTTNHRISKNSPKLHYPCVLSYKKGEIKKLQNKTVL